MATKTVDTTRTEIAGTVVFVNPRSRPDWTACKVLTVDGEHVSVVAKFRIGDGHPVHLQGKWKDHPKYGWQFDATGPVVGELSGTLVGDWMAREVYGCGPAKAAKAVEAFGDDLGKAILDRPDEVAAATGLDPHVVREAGELLAESRVDVKAVEALVERGVEMALAVKVVDKLGGALLPTILDDPFYILGKVARVGWDTADHFAARLGVGRDDPRRVRAAIDHVCARLSEGEGHTAYPEALLVENLAELADLLPEDCLAHVRASPRLGVYEPGLYTHARWADHERQIEKALAYNPRLLSGPRVEELADQYASLPNGKRLEGRQLDAFKAAMYSRVVLVTGGAGAGKTTVIQTIANAFESLGMFPYLVAPTGKAAVRLAEVTGRPAGTMHRFLGLTPTAYDEERRADRDIDAHSASCVIADEQSMSDAFLAASLLKTVNRDCRVVLVGDPNQLPSVGPGAVLRDLIHARKVPHVHLDHCHRQAGTLLHNCYSILNGGRDELFHSPDPADRPAAPWIFHQLADANLVAQSVAGLFAGGCRDKLAVEPHDLMLVTPTNRGKLGVDALNRVVQVAYQKAHNQLDVRYGSSEARDKFFVGDRVVWKKNNYTLNLMNGELGRVLEATSTWVRVAFETRGEVDIGLKEQDDLALAWAMTAHRMQGSQCPKVVVLCAPEHVDNWGLKHILNRALFYTACTRSRQATVVLGDRDAVKAVLAREQRDSRVTTLFRGEGR
jgi:exodeoxyribonuclease V alpha subunit